jgi:hypothetical protein
VNGTVEVEMADTVEVPFDDLPETNTGDQPAAPQFTEREIPHAYSQNEISETFVYCNEQERALICLLWWNPRFIPVAQRELDFGQHFVCPARRAVLEALTFAYSQFGDASWGTVVEIVRQLGLNDEAGGLDNLNSILTDRGRFPEGPPKHNLDLFLNEYIRAVKAYALGRGANPFTAPTYYTDGSGVLRRNKLAHQPSDPVCAGPIRVLGHSFTTAGWWDADGELQLKLRLERKQRHGRH